MLVKCDNQAIVSTLTSGRARDPFLGACARNIWYETALRDIDVQYVHVLGQNNRTADLLSRSNSSTDMQELQLLVNNPIWLPVNIDMLELDNNI